MLATWSKNEYPTSKKKQGDFFRYSRCLFCAPGRLRVCPTNSSTTITIPPCVVSIRSGHLNFGSEAVERVTKGRSVGVEHVPDILLLKTWARVSGPPIHQDAGERGGGVDPCSTRGEGGPRGTTHLAKPKEAWSRTADGAAVARRTTCRKPMCWDHCEGNLATLSECYVVFI